MNSSKKQKHLLRFERAEVRQYKHFPDGEEVLMGVTPDAFLTRFQSRYWAAPGSNFQNVFSYGGWGSEGDKMSFPWSGENPINLQLNGFSCSRPLVYFIKPMPASVLFCFGFVWCHPPRRTIKWPIVCLGFGIYWFSSCIPLNLISTWRLSMWATTSQRAARSTAGQLWTCEKGQGPASLFQMLFLKFLPTLLPTSLARLVCSGQGEGVFMILLLFELLR